MNFGGGMAEIQRIGDLEISVDQEFQRREWRVERIGWGIMLLIIIAALLGLLGGPGPLSNTSVSSGESLEVSYQRFAHLLEPNSLELRIRLDQGQESVRVWLNQTYLENMQIEEIAPEPQSVEAADGRFIYDFALAAPVEEVRIVFHLNPEQFGTKQGAVGIEGGQSVELSQVVYP
jgi:hypothetical protein